MVTRDARDDRDLALEDGGRLIVGLDRGVLEGGLVVSVRLGRGLVSFSGLGSGTIGLGLAGGGGLGLGGRGAVDWL